jgi:tRNA pseudouridine38-40 synthase
MSLQRYFLEVAYFGEGLSGFQIQENAPTVQSSVAQAFLIFFRRPIELTGSSRTDAGVHAYQNFFHFDWEGAFDYRAVYNLNALLPDTIAIISVREVPQDAHARFSALSRHYGYVVYNQKDPFLLSRGWYYPYALDKSLLQRMAQEILNNTYFEAFSKRNTQVKTYRCSIVTSKWVFGEGVMKYEVAGNRFLRGMVRGLVSSMLQVGRGNKTEDWFNRLFEEGNKSQADFSAPPQGLFLEKVVYPAYLFE